MKLLFSSKEEEIEVLSGLLSEANVPHEITQDKAPPEGGGAESKLWVPESHFRHSCAVLDSFQKVLIPQPGPWRCPSCGQALDERFWCCWKCGVGRNEAPNSG